MNVFIRDVFYERNACVDDLHTRVHASLVRHLLNPTKNNRTNEGRLNAIIMCLAPSLKKRKRQSVLISLCKPLSL